MTVERANTSARDVQQTDEQRPRTRADCVHGSRPCGWITCRHHVVTVKSFSSGTVHADRLILKRHADEQAIDAFADRVADLIASLPETCALDVADSNPDGLGLREVGQVLRVARERIRQIAEEAAPGLASLRAELKG